MCNKIDEETRYILTESREEEERNLRKKNLMTKTMLPGNFHARVILKPVNFVTRVVQNHVNPLAARWHTALFVALCSNQIHSFT